MGVSGSTRLVPTGRGTRSSFGSRRLNSAGASVASKRLRTGTWVGTAIDVVQPAGVEAYQNMYGTGQSVKPQWWCSVPDRLLQHRCAGEFRSGLRPYLRSTAAAALASASRIAIASGPARLAGRISSNRRGSSWCGPNRTQTALKSAEPSILAQPPVPFGRRFPKNRQPHGRLLSVLYGPGRE